MGTEGGGLLESKAFRFSGLNISFVNSFTSLFVFFHCCCCCFPELNGKSAKKSLNVMYFFIFKINICQAQVFQLQNWE